MWYTPPNCTQHLLVITKTKTVVIIDPKCVLPFGALWPRDSPPYCWTVSLRQVILLPKFLLSPWSSLTLSALPGRVASCCCVWKVSCWKGLLLSEDLAWTPPNKAAYSLLPVVVLSLPRSILKSSKLPHAFKIQQTSNQYIIQSMLYNQYT